jgi:DNA-3-methyladenine glycosylase I
MCIFEGEYHDAVWGVPVVESAALFAQLSLCTQQCGVSWKIVWNKRHHYREAFHGWDMRKVAAMSEADVDVLCDKQGAWAGKLIQNRSKLGAIVHNARQCVAIDDSVAGGLSAFLWAHVASDSGGGAPLEVRIDGLGTPLRVRDECVNAYEDHTCSAYSAAFGVTSEVSDRLAACLKRKDGAPAAFAEPYRFLGSTTLQAFLLQCGLLNGHAPSCAKNPRHESKKRRGGAALDTPPTSRRRRGGGGVSASSSDDVWL